MAVGGWSALHFAVERGDMEIVRFLLDQKLDPDLCGERAMRFGCSSV